MVTLASKVLDSAFVLALLSAAFYFLGLLNAEGEAAALGLPRSLLQRDVWNTVAYGGEGFLVLLVLLPVVSLGPEGVGWLAWITFSVGILLVLTSFYLFRTSPQRIFWILGAVYLGVSIHVMIGSYAQMNKKIELATICLSRKQCDSVPLRNRIVFAKTEQQEDQRVGVILTASDHFLVMLSRSGFVVIPVARIKLMETAPDA
ncbi:hypothetical protein [Polaromonas sp. DSR2-3-2]|uniref:hypothetical protein n=1 Tax=unclassified Polaromonas TaxID=2638319 RepID=UPI003CEF4CE4